MWSATVDVSPYHIQGTELLNYDFILTTQTLEAVTVQRERQIKVHA